MATRFARPISGYEVHVQKCRTVQWKDTHTHIDRCRVGGFVLKLWVSQLGVTALPCFQKVLGAWGFLRLAKYAVVSPLSSLIPLAAKGGDAILP